MNDRENLAFSLLAVFGLLVFCLGQQAERWMTGSADKDVEIAFLVLAFSSCSVAWGLVRLIRRLKDI